jgi:hypothetical protein
MRAERLADGSSVAVGLDQGGHHRPDIVEAGALAEVVVGPRTILEEAQFGGRQCKFLAELLALQGNLLADALQGMFDRHAGLDAEQHQIERIRPGTADRLLPLDRAVLEQEHWQIGAEQADEQRVDGVHPEWLVGKDREAQVSEADNEENEGRDEAQEDVGGERSLPAIAGTRQGVDGILIGQQLLQREAIDDIAHVLATGNAADAALIRIGAATQASHLLGTHLLALQGYPLDARLHLRTAPEERGSQREHDRSRRDRREHRDQKVRVSQGPDEVVHRGA